jgi:hypothetical protein
VESSRRPTVAKNLRRIHPVCAQACTAGGAGICFDVMRPSVALFPLLCVAVSFLLAGCKAKSQTAVVLSKKFVPALKAPADGTEPAPQEGTTPHDRWLVRVEMADGKKVDADVDKAQWNHLRVGDKVQAAYSQGNYTGTVWRIDLSQPAPAAAP